MTTEGSRARSGSTLTVLWAQPAPVLQPGGAGGCRGAAITADIASTITENLDSGCYVSGLYLLGADWDIVTDMALKLVPGGHPYHALGEAGATTLTRGGVLDINSAANNATGAAVLTVGI